MTLPFPPDPNACWEWQGGTNLDGYGQVRLMPTNSGVVGIQRLAYRLFKGRIPRGYEIDHLCKNRRCANPRHLEAVPKAENIRRSPKRSTTPRQDYPTSTLWRLRSARGYSREELGNLAGVSPWTIWNVERGFTNPRNGTVQRLAEALDLDPSELLEDEVAS